MNLRLFTLVLVPSVLSLGGCSFLKDEPDSKVVYSDPLDETWYNEPAVQEQTAQAKPLTSRNTPMEKSQPESSFGSTPVQDPSWGNPVDTTVGADTSPPSGEPDSSSEIVGAPISGGAVPDSPPKAEGGSLIASRSAVGTDAGDTYSSLARTNAESEAPKLRFETTPPPVLADSSDTGGLTVPGRRPAWNPPSQEYPSPPPRTPDTTPAPNMTSPATPVDPSFEDSSQFSQPSPGAVPPNVGGGTIPPAPAPTFRDPMTVSVPSRRAETTTPPKPAPEAPAGPIPNAGTLKNHAVDQYKAGNFAESTRLFRQFQSAYPEQSTDWVQWHLAQSLLEQGLWGESGEEFRKLVGSPNRELRAEALLKLGIIDAKRGNLDIAQNRWNRILENYPDTKAAKRATQELSQTRP